jgi:hypothetical protein
MSNSSVNPKHCELKKLNQWRTTGMIYWHQRCFRAPRTCVAKYGKLQCIRRQFLQLSGIFHDQ